MSTDDNPFNWWKYWDIRDQSESWKKMATDWKKWVPDPAKMYVSSPLELPVKVNPIFKGNQPLPPVEKDLCSVILPFGKKQIGRSIIDFDSVYKDCIKPPLQDGGFRIMKADEIFAPANYITENIWRLINRSALLIADVTGKNPNVFYELGIAHTIGRDVIIISQNKEDVPFDIQNLQYYLYNADNEKGKEKLKEDLRNLIKSIKPVMPNVFSPGFWWQM